MTQYNFLKTGLKNEIRNMTDIEYDTYMAATELIRKKVGYFLSKLYDHNKFDERFNYLVQNNENKNIYRVSNIIEVDDVTDGYIIPKDTIVNVFKLCVITLMKSPEEVTDKTFVPITLEEHSERHNYRLLGLSPISENGEDDKFVFEEDLITCNCSRCSLMKMDINGLWDSWNPTNHLEILLKQFAMFDFEEIFN